MCDIHNKVLISFMHFIIIITKYFSSGGNKIKSKHPQQCLSINLSLFSFGLMGKCLAKNAGVTIIMPSLK